MTKRRFYAWEGQNASTGTPNRHTGQMSMYGRNLVFKTKKLRDEYVEGFRSNNPSEYCVACTKAELRGYNLGMSVHDFELELDQADYVS